VIRTDILAENKHESGSFIGSFRAVGVPAKCRRRQRETLQESHARALCDAAETFYSRSFAAVQHLVQRLPRVRPAVVGQRVD
jgi:hypothetical protein